MATLEAERTRRAVEIALAAVRRKPGITVAELATELKLDPETLTQALATAMANAVPDRDDLDPELWGRRPSAQQLAGAWEVGEQAQRAAMADVLADALTREQAAERLEITTQAISEQRKGGKLVALRRGREWRFPRWQFGDDGALPGLPELISAWPGTSLALSLWAINGSPDLDGRAPSQEMIRRGGIERVLDLLEAISAAAW
jgi:hypothetical protein